MFFFGEKLRFDEKNQFYDDDDDDDGLGITIEN